MDYSKAEAKLAARERFTGLWAAITVPFGRVVATADRPPLPIGVQLMGPARAERRLFELARFLEREGPPS